MDNKQSWTTVIVGAVVAVIVFVVMSMISPAIGLSPGVGVSQQAFVNANECTRDGVCEVSPLSGSSNGTVIIKDNLDVEVDVKARDFLVLGKLLGPTYGGEIRFLSNMLRIQSRPNNPVVLYSSSSELARFESNRDVILNGLAGGNGTDYVCVDGQGKLFRSNTAC